MAPVIIKKGQYEKSLRSLSWAGAFVTLVSDRPWALNLFHRLVVFGIGFELKGFVNDEIRIPSTTTSGHTIRTRIYKPMNVKDPLPAVMIFMHGGGYQVGLPEQDHPFFAKIMKKRNICIVAPDYRLSLVHNSPYPHGLNDCYDTVKYCKDHATELGLLPNTKFILAGHSGGGGMTAALTLKVVDTQVVDLAFVMPIYPMLDHRMNTPSAQMVGSWVWDCESNKGAWGRYLANVSGEEVPEYASPALREDLSNLPPTISFVGTLEPFRDEVVTFMDKLRAANIPTKFKVYQGGFHGFETLGPTTDLGIEANNFQINSFAEYFDTFVLQDGK